MTKPGLKTTEFAASQASTGGLFGVFLSETDWRVKAAVILAIAVIQGCYALSRGLEKSIAKLEAPK